MFSLANFTKLCYTYDMLGDTAYIYNTNAKLSQLLMKTANDIVTKYVYGRGLIGEEVSGAFKTYHFDSRGSTIAITDASGNITDTFAYDTYGKLLSRTGTSKVIFGYNGRDGVVTDANGLIYMRARYYSPEMKRFVNADIVPGKISNAITLNRYAYANGNPVSFVDPLGLSAWSWLKNAAQKTWDFLLDLGDRISAINSQQQEIDTKIRLEQIEIVENVMKPSNPFSNIDLTDGSTNGKDTPAENIGEAIFDAVVYSVCTSPVTNIFREIHYNRNVFNDTYSEKELIDAKHQPLDEKDAKFHQNNQKNGKENTKYVIGDWFSSEVVFYSDGTVNNTPEDVGTFNVYSGENGFLNGVVHGLFDVVPYMLWGNSHDDSSSIIDRFQMIFQ